MIAWIKLVALFFSVALELYHPVHVSVANVEFKEKDKKAIVSIKLFEDDLKLLFYHLNQVEIDFYDSSSYNKYKDLIIPYFETNFVIVINKKSMLNLNISDWKINEDAIWFYFESSYKSNFESLEIKNTILLDIYSDQKNLVIIKTKTKELGYQFDYKTTQQQISFDR